MKVFKSQRVFPLSQAVNIAIIGLHPVLPICAQ